MPRRILLADGNPINRKILRGILDACYDVTEAQTGEEALLLLRAHGAGISAVVLNLAMPGPDGCEAFALLRGDPALARIPILALTDGENGEAEEKALSLGISDFILPSCSAALIRRRVENAVRLAEATASFEKLRISEERYRIAASAGGRVTARYDIAAGVYYRSSEPLTALNLPEVIKGVPQKFLDDGVIASGSIRDYLIFFKRMESGERSCEADLSILVGKGRYRWFHCDASMIFDAQGRPSQAIIVYTDITEQREKEAVYIKWQQSLQQKPPETYTLFHCNLSRDSSFESMDGELLKKHVKESALPFNLQTQEYAIQFVHPDDRENYFSTVNSDLLLANYYRNKRTETLEYREVLPEGATRWLRLTIELVEYPNSTDVGAYLMYENIDGSKREELKAKELAERDPLTGVLNRAAFERQVGEILERSKASAHAFLIMDVDYFKRLNDTFGHAAGDQALIDIANGLRSVLRHGDLLGRLGGDEFVILMRDIPYDAIIEKKARQICAFTRKAFSADVQISASIGIAVYPRDGQSFETLYAGADTALYSVKESGKDAFAFFDREVQRQHPPLEEMSVSAPIIAGGKPLRRMLIVDDSAIDRAMLANLFKSEYIIETANDGAAAVMRLRHYGASISVVLLDLLMPGMDGFEVLEKMQAGAETRSIPVIVVSGQEEKEVNLRAIKAGASDYVTKPVEPDLIRLRVESVVSKAESERLRAQNSYLVLQSSEEAKYRTILDSTGTVVIEYDWMNGVFSYDPSISEHIAGVYNNRRLWQILLSDMVAETADVKAMQELVHKIANDRTREDGSLIVKLKTPRGEKQWFRMRIFKRADEYQLTNKMIITYLNINGEVLSSQQLRFKAERDDLTGVYNRSTFFELAAEKIAAKPAGYYVLSSVDIDNFKVINDQYGTEKGDEVLRGLANVLNRCAADGGLCGRIAADNFVTLYRQELLLEDPDYQRGHTNAIFEEISLPITISVGRYVVADKQLSVSAMYDRANIAQESVKRRFDTHMAVYDESMRRKLLRAQEIVNEMNTALKAGQFEAWFHPQYNYATGALVGAEALARWRHPERGLVPPGDFISVFEKNGFIYELDKFIWERACRYLRKRIDAGRTPLLVSVNLSRYDLLRPDVVEVITGLVEQYGVPVHLLCLEITESAFTESTDQVIAVVKRLIACGFTVEIDDFGSGYSSLNTLKDVPAQIVKLDMRFLEGGHNTNRGGNIIESIVRMVKWLGMSLIAEGVETTAQADYLKTIGCIYVQGYLYARPMPEAEYEALEESAFKEERLLSPKGEGGLHNALWSPNSMDTLLFNAYAGSACIFEYCGGRIELLRANDGYARMLGSTAMNTADLLKLDWIGYFDEESRAAVTAAIERSARSKTDISGEHTLLHLPGCPARTCLRTTLRVIAKTGERSLVYCVSENTTARREAEEQLFLLHGSIPGGTAAYLVSPGEIRIVNFNDGFCRLLGLTREECESLSPEDAEGAVFEEDRPLLRERAHALLSGETALRCDVRVHVGGGCRWVRLNGIAGARRGSAVYVSTVLCDVTAQKCAEQPASSPETAGAAFGAESGAQGRPL